MKELLNNELSLNVPEGFRVLTKEEIQKFNTAEGEVGWAIQSEADHIILSVSWKEYNALLAGLADLGAAAKKNESTVAKLMKDYGYQLKGFNDFNVGEREAKGYTYTYTAQQTGMESTAMLVKKGRTVYYIYAYYRQAQAENSLAAVREILAGALWQ